MCYERVIEAAFLLSSDGAVVIFFFSFDHGDLSFCKLTDNYISNLKKDQGEESFGERTPSDSKVNCHCRKEK